MIVVDPVLLGDVSFSGGGGSYYDKAGVLQTAAPGVPRLTYDPADLSKSPAIMLEPEFTNLLRMSEGFEDALWGKGPNSVAVTPNAAASPKGDMTADLLTALAADSYVNQLAPIVGRSTCTFSVWLRASSPVTLTLSLSDSGGGGTATQSVCNVTTSWQRFYVTHTPSAGSTGVYSQVGGSNSFTLGEAVFAWGGQLVLGAEPMSYVKTVGDPVARAADVVGTTSGLLYSNVAEPEPLWAAGTYAKGAKVRDVAHVAYESLVDANAAPLTDKTKWLNLGATNRAAMFDDRNNTQTSNPEEIIVVLSPRAIAQGLLLGNLDATDIGVSVTVPNYGVAYSETSSLIVSRSKSSFFRWGFNRLKRRSLFLTLKLPIFFNGVVTVTIRRPGGVAKCGMCMIGPTVDPGPTLMGLSSEIKDYSTTLFNTDGSSETIPRGYRKLMSMDVSIDTDRVVEAEEQMIAWKQKNVVWVGAPSRLDTIIVGRYSSFKKVIESFPRSKMALQIEGVLS